MIYGPVEHRRPTVDCCAWHGRSCVDEPCCNMCTECTHDLEGFMSGTHRNGSPCAGPDLSDYRARL